MPTWIVILLIIFGSIGVVLWIRDGIRANRSIHIARLISHCQGNLRTQLLQVEALEEKLGTALEAWRVLPETEGLTAIREDIAELRKAVGATHQTLQEKFLEIDQVSAITANINTPEMLAFLKQDKIRLAEMAQDFEKSEKSSERLLESAQRLSKKAEKNLTTPV